jgi:hypothetical protein
MRFEMDTLYLTHRQVSDVLFKNQAAYTEFRAARRANTFAGLLGFSGAVLLAIPVANAILGGEPDFAFVAGGGALVIASIPLSFSYKRKAERAIDTYNAGLTTGASIYWTGSAVGIKF